MKRTMLTLLALFLTTAAWAQPTAVQTPAQKADKAVRSPNGTLVRVVGALFDKDDAVTKDTDVGDVVVVQSVDNGRVLCNVVLYAKSIKKSKFYDDAEMRGTTADVPELKNHFEKNGASRPVFMPGTCDGENVCAWNVLLAGDACKLVGDSPHFVSSTLKEMWDLPSVRARLLVTDGICKDDEGKDVGCTVSVGDPKATPGKKIRFNHSWAGRWQDLNFRQRQNGEYLERVRPDKLGAAGKMIP